MATRRDRERYNQNWERDNQAWLNTISDRFANRVRDIITTYAIFTETTGRTLMHLETFNLIRFHLKLRQLATTLDTTGETLTKSDLEKIVQAVRLEVERGLTTMDKLPVTITIPCIL